MTDETRKNTPPARPRLFRARSGRVCRLPLFLPVLGPGFSVDEARREDFPPFRGCMINAYFLYKQRELRRRFREGLTLREHVGFDGLLCTDSGAFQGFSRRLLLSNRDIVRFQDEIRTDIAAPLDLVTPPGDGREVAERKLATTQKRIAEALELAEHCIVAGVQQGGRFIDLRLRSVEELAEMGVEYLAIGSLVPFFNKNHDLGFVGRVIGEARRVIGPDVPIHVYGAGDPSELPFMAALGADIFDSSSYAHFAGGGWYMTPYGALRDPGPLLAGEHRCRCPVCAKAEKAGGVGEVLADRAKLTLHNLWTIHESVEGIGAALDRGGLEGLTEKILRVHETWFPGSALPSSWRALHE